MSCERILVVDDDRAAARKIELQLSKLGYVVVSTADNGPDAIAKAGACAPDLLLIDIHLGYNLGGIETARVIRQKYQVPVVYLSARNDADTLARAKDTQPLGYVQKPPRDADLRNTLLLALTRMKTDPDPATPVPSAADYGTLWRIKLTCGTDGRLIRVPQEAKLILQRLRKTHIQDLLPTNHGERIRACLDNKKPQLLFTGDTGEVMALEYLPATNGIIHLVISGQPDRKAVTDGVQINPLDLLDTLDHLTAGIILFNEHLQIFYSNKSALKLLAAGAGLSNHHGYLACRDPAITADLKNLAIDQKDHLLAIDRGGDRLALNVLVTTLKSSYANVGKNLPTSILFAFETTDNYARIEEVVRSLYRLSPSEAKLVSQLFINPQLPNAAMALGITLNTARTHLKRIYNKTGVNRIASLIHMIVTGPASIILNTDS